MGGAGRRQGGAYHRVAGAAKNGVLTKTAGNCINCSSAHPRGRLTKPHRVGSRQNLFGSKLEFQKIHVFQAKKKLHDKTIFLLHAFTAKKKLHELQHTQGGHEKKVVEHRNDVIFLWCVALGNLDSGKYSFFVCFHYSYCATQRRIGLRVVR